LPKLKLNLKLQTCKSLTAYYFTVKYYLFISVNSWIASAEVKDFPSK